MSVVDEPLGEPQPRQLIVSVYGLYARDTDGWLPVAGLVRLMAELGVGPPAVRSSISRLKRRDTLRSLRRGEVAGYALAPSMAEILREGDRRIFGHQPATPADGWVQVVFTVPGDAAGQAARAAQPAGRPRLRADGAGCLGRAGDAGRRGAGRAGPAGPDRLRRPLPWRVPGGGQLGYAPLADRVREWWDLPGIEGRYAAFVAAHRPLARRVARRPPSPGEAFAAYVRMLTAWRRLRYLDPGLPLELLPPRWKGVTAAALFEELDRRLAPTGRPARARGARRGLIAAAAAGSSAVPCTSTSASSSHSRATPMPAVAG